jgi:hypothetical protein
MVLFHDCHLLEELYQAPAAPSSDAPAYEYDPLRESEIRLLQLYPPRESGDSIRISLHIHPGDTSCLDYEALSYTWGESKTGSKSW